MAGDGGIGRPGKLERHAGFALAKDEAGIAHGRNETERFGRMARMGRLGSIAKIGKRKAIAIGQAGGKERFCIGARGALGAPCRQIPPSNISWVRRACGLAADKKKDTSLSTVSLSSRWIFPNVI